MKLLKNLATLVVLLNLVFTGNVIYAQTDATHDVSRNGHKTYKRGKIYDSEVGALTKKPQFQGDRAADRAAYEFNLLKNPYTGKIPKNIRVLEQTFSKNIPQGDLISKKLSKQFDNKGLNTQWESRGPYNIGGRTRAMALDLNNESIIFAGGVSGGLWRSVDAGASWTRVTKKDANPSITDIVQDPRPNYRHIWYFASGEFLGNSASQNGAAYQGTGIYKSEDNGLTWSQLASTNDNNFQTSTALDYISHIAVHPVSGNLYASAPDGIWKYSDSSFENVIEITNSPYTFVTISPTGTIYATASFDNGNTQAGIYISEDETNWSNITPSEFLNAPFGKMVAAVTPSNENIVWFLAYNPDNKDHFLWKFDKENATWTNKAATIANIASGLGALNLQYGYNMTLKVHPTNPDVVFLGGTNLYRTKNGFETNLSKTNWIGGYHKNGTAELYANHHADQHQILFLPSDPSKIYSANDGGVFKTNNGLAQDVSWISLNNGYQTTQTYSLAIDESGTHNHIITGFQDNGTWMSTSSNLNTPWENLFGGDGSYNAFANNGQEYYISHQYGNIYKFKADNSNYFARVTPGSQITPDQFSFITPFKIDPNHNNTMYLANGRVVLVNTKLDRLVSGTYEQNTEDWFRISGVSSYPITAMDVSTYPVQNRLYYGASNGAIYKVERANLSSARRSHNLASGKNLGSGQISCIYVDPTNSDRVFIVKSNYGVKSIWLTEDAGETFTSISGNLEENLDGSGNGPSVRWITSIGNNEGYLVGTSTGLYSTTELNGDNTQWQRELIKINNDELEDILVTQIKSRKDGMTAVGTHGNGVFNTYFDVTPRPENHLTAYPADPININNINTSKTFDLSSYFSSNINAPISLNVLANSNSGLANFQMSGTDLIVSNISQSTEGNTLITVEATSGEEKAAVLLDITIRPFGVYEQFLTKKYITPSNYDYTGEGRLAQCADDFTVPEGYQWTINKVIAFGESLGYRVKKIDEAAVEIYSDANGKPGELVYTTGKVNDLNIVPDNKGGIDLEIPFDTTLQLDSGTYWVSVYAYLNYYPYFLNWVWYSSSTVTGYESQFKNPMGLWNYSSNPDNPYYVAKDWTKQSVLFNSEPTDHSFFIMGETNLLSNTTFETKNITVSPNPNKGSFNINGFKNTTEPLIIKVLDLQGREVYNTTLLNTNTTNFQIDLPQNTKGIFLLHMSSNSQTVTKKIIVN